MAGWDRTPGRVSGRAGVELRARRLAREPLCRHCAAKGLTTRAAEVDHIQPLAFGGEDVDDNVQSLCFDCHAIKTAAESAAHEGASNHPEWLERSAVPLTILCGPPCSGKTTYIKANAGPLDILIDVDTIAQGVSPGYQHWNGQLDSGLLNQSIRIRNAMLGSLARRKGGRAWFIVSAPTEAERQWWADRLGGTVVLLHPGIAECKRRAVSRGTPRAIKGVDDWERSSRKPWTPPEARVKRTGCDESGWPTGADHPWNASSAS